MEDFSFQRKSVILVVPVLLPLQPSQASPSPETCQLISYTPKGFADNYSHATLFLHSCWMYGSNTADKQTCASGLVTSRDRGSLCKERDGIKSQEMCTVRAVDALSQLVFQPCRKGCASPRSATDPCCSHFFPQSWISAGFRRRRAPAETLC